MNAKSAGCQNQSPEGAAVALPGSAAQSARPVRIALVDDEESMHRLLQRIFKKHAPEWILDSYPDARQALRQIPTLLPDAVLMDLNMPDLTGIECLENLQTVSPHLPVVILSAHVDPEAWFRSMKAGACGCLCKPVGTADLLLALEKTLNGSMAFCPQAERTMRECFSKLGRNEDLSRLTRREREILACLGDQESDKEIADKLCITRGTVHVHTARLFKKLSVHSRSEAVHKLAAAHHSL